MQFTGGTLSFYRPQTKLGQGNIFRSVCQEFCPGGVRRRGDMHGRGVYMVEACVVGGGACAVGGVRDRYEIRSILLECILVMGVFGPRRSLFCICYRPCQRSGWPRPPPFLPASAHPSRSVHRLLHSRSNWPMRRRGESTAWPIGAIIQQIAFS